jgi:hypothetical protein
MSTYDDASLILYPSGYKEDKIYSLKPTDGSGDLTFTRASTATRVNADGLIEKVRTNLVLQSNTFNTSWTASNATVTSGQAGYDGTNNAWFLTASSTSNAYIEQSIAITGVHNYSIYLKKGTSDFAVLTIEGIYGGYSYFNLATGALGTAVGVTASIQSIGNGWHRCSIAAAAILLGNAVRAYVTDADNSPNVTNGKNILIQAAQTETGEIATDYIPTTTTAVSVGMTANVPRIDYTGGGCGKLLLEPQRSNLALYSEQFDNAGNWYTANTTVSANIATSPDGYTNADRLATTAANGYLSNAVAISISADASSYTQSIFVKWVSGSEVIKLRAALTNGTSVAKESSINIRTGVVVSTDTTAQVVSYGSGWYRISHQITNNSTNTNGVYQFYPTNDGTNTNVIYLWGASLEAGSYSSSYIPTLASVTRLADAASKTGISSLINSAEGVLYAEIKGFENDTISRRISLSNGTATERLFIDLQATQNRVRCEIVTPSGGASLVYIGIVQTNFNKIAFTWKSGNFQIWLNGVKVIFTTVGNIPSGLNQLSFSNGITPPSDFFYGNIKQLQLYKISLTDTQLTTLTTL